MIFYLLLPKITVALSLFFPVGPVQCCYPALKNNHIEEQLMKKLTLAVFTAWTLISASVFATPIALPGGPLFFEFLTAEQYSKTNDINNIKNPRGAGTPPEGNWGIAEVTSILAGKALAPTGSQIDPLGPTIFSNGQNGGQQILGIFYGVQNNPGSPDTSKFGTLDLYFWSSNSQNVSSEFSNASLAKRSGIDGSQYTGFTCQANTLTCTFLARFRFTPGADVSSQINTIFSPLGSSDFESYLSVDTATPGAWTDLLNTNYFTLNPINQTCGATTVSCTSANDLRADGHFTQFGAGGWDIAGTDIIGLAKNGAFRALVVPEPNSLALFCIGLIVAGAAGARRCTNAQHKHAKSNKSMRTQCGQTRLIFAKDSKSRGQNPVALADRLHPLAFT